MVYRIDRILAGALIAGSIAGFIGGLAAGLMAGRAETLFNTSGKRLSFICLVAIVTALSAAVTAFATGILIRRYRKTAP